MEVNTTKCLVSIITPSYNSAKFIGETIEAIQAQTYTTWELLITDDCSSDNSIEVIQQYAAKDPRVKVLTLSKNGGAGAARNNSIEHAQGRYIAFCDSDDKWLPEKLEKQLKLMDEKKAGCCYGAYYHCDEGGKRMGILPVKPELSLLEEKHANQIGMLTGIYDTQFTDGKVFMPLIRKRQDWAMWLKVMMKCQKAVGIMEPIAEYRIRHNSISRNKKEMVKYNAAIYEQVYNYPHWFAMLYTLFINIPTILIKKSKLIPVK